MTTSCTSTAAPVAPTVQHGYNSRQLRRHGDVSVVEVGGQLIVGNRQHLKQIVLDELEAGGRKFAIDFAAAGYIDTSGLGVLVSLSKRIHERGGRLVLSGLNDDLTTLLELTGIAPLFSVADTLPVALASLEASR